MTEEEQIEAELIERELNKRNSSKRNNLFNKIGESVKSNPIGQAGLGFAQGLADVAPAIGNLAIKGSNYANKNNIPEYYFYWHNLILLLLDYLLLELHRLNLEQNQDQPDL